MYHCIVDGRESAMPVKKATQASPNLLLRQARLARGWTQQEVANLIDAPHAFMINRWESGVVGPSAVYRQRLAALFEQDLEALGLLPPLQGDLLTPLLAIRLHQPRLRTQLVPRSHLVARLQQGVAGALTLVSAPAGFGKTTLLAQWRASTRAPVAWLSLEPEDNEPTRFLTYFIVALPTLDPHPCARALALLALPQPEEPATVLTLLANDLIGWQGEDFALVLDDYHVITAAPIHRALTYLVEHLPPQMHLILATRSDPPLPL